MEPIKGYLQKIARISLPDDTLKRLLIEILATNFNIVLERRHIKVRQGVIIIEASPLVKSEIYIHQSEILAQLKTILGPKAPTEIR